MFFIVASIYWYFSGHATPAIIGYVMLLMFSERVYFVAILTGGAGISSVIYYFYSDFFAYSAGDDILQYGVGVLYMLILFIKAKRIFDNDEFSLD